MAKQSTTLFFALILLGLAPFVKAEPVDELVKSLNPQVLRVQAGLSNGSYGLGSGVVVAKDQIVTNCHVIANAVSISVTSNGASYPITSIKTDWHHDVCMLKAEGLDAPIAKIGASKKLKYEQPVFTIGYPGFLPVPTSTYGVVKGLIPMDGSMIIRATSTFKSGASGGGVFDHEGNLVGIITLKSPGRNAYYYNMPVEWVQALMEQPEQPINGKSEKPFWAEHMNQWPHFMKVVQPYLTQDWQALSKVANEWVLQEPNTSEAWFYLAAAEYANKDYEQAEAHLMKVLSINQQHSDALYYLGMIEESTGRHTEAMNSLAQLNQFDEQTASQLKVAMSKISK